MRNLVAVVLVLAACGKEQTKTNGQVLEPLEPKYAARRQQLAAIAASLPPVGGVENGAMPKSLPKPFIFVYDGTDERKNQQNVAIMMFDELVDPDVEPQKERFDLLFDGPLSRCLRWTGPKDPSLPTMRNAPATPGVLACASALDDPYLVVVRTVKFVVPEAVDATTYKGGGVALELFVVDLATSKVLGTTHVLAVNDDHITFTYDPSRAVDKAGRLAAFAHSELWGDARQQVMSQLAAIGGAKVSYR
jgi:hypothetical protein